MLRKCHIHTPRFTISPFVFIYLFIYLFIFGDIPTFKSKALIRAIYTRKNKMRLK